MPQNHVRSAADLRLVAVARLIELLERPNGAPDTDELPRLRRALHEANTDHRRHLPAVPSMNRGKAR